MGPTDRAGQVNGDLSPYVVCFSFPLIGSACGVDRLAPFVEK